MRLSANEYFALVRTAAMGKGLPVGTADEIAAAALWQAGQGTPTATAWLQRPARDITASLTAADRNQPGDDLTRALTGARREPPTLDTGLDLPETQRETLLTLAARTRVPATDASRLGGAGAGLVDND